MNIEETILGVERLYKSITGVDVNDVRPTSSFVTGNLDLFHMVEMRAHELFQTLNDPNVIRELLPISPLSSVYENDEKLLIKLALPGVKKEIIDISLNGNQLTVTGNVNVSRMEADYVCRTQEIQKGFFIKQFMLPVDKINSEIHSDLSDGILTITLSKSKIEDQKQKSKKQ